VKKPVKVTVITVLVLVGVFLAADYGLAAAAEYQISKKMRTQLDLASDPSVDIHGFPFITQAISGDYKDIAINAVGIPAGNLKELEIDADLQGVREPLSAILSGNISTIKVDEVDGEVKVKATDIGRLINLPDLTINPVSLDTVLGAGAQDSEDQQDQLQEPGNPDPIARKAGLEMSATINLAGQQTKVNAFGVISLDDGAVVITPRKLTLSNGLVSGDIPDTLLQGFVGQFRVKLSSSQLPLPFTVRATGVDVQSGAVVVQGQADDVVINTGSVSG
jgi:hypothetical protein